MLLPQWCLLYSVTAIPTAMTEDIKATAVSRPNFPHHLQISIKTEVELDDEDATPKTVDITCGGHLIPSG